MRKRWKRGDLPMGVEYNQEAVPVETTRVML